MNQEQIAILIEQQFNDLEKVEKGGEDQAEIFVDLFAILGPTFKLALQIVDTKGVTEYRTSTPPYREFHMTKDETNHATLVLKKGEYCSCREFIRNLLKKTGYKCKHVVAVKLATKLRSAEVKELDQISFCSEMKKFQQKF